MLKRLFDLTLTIFGLFIIWPLVLLLAILVRFKLGAPVLFYQQRPGLRGQPFLMYKFRTMTDERDTNGNLLPDVDRLTPFGRFVRSSSLGNSADIIFNYSQ